MLQLDDGNDNGKTSAYLIGWNEPNYNTPMFQRALAEIQAAKTQAQRLAVVKKYPGIRSVTRFLFGYDDTNTSQMMLADSKGQPRIKMYVTADGQAQLQFLDASGKVTAHYPQ